MRNYIKLFSLFVLLSGFTSCQKDNLENYFVKASENPDFFVVNIPANMIEFDKKKLDKQTINQISSIKKFNILMFKNDKSLSEKKAEYQKLKNILDSKYKYLFKVKNKGYKIDLSYEGNPESIDKLIFFGKDDNYNFMLGLVKSNSINVNSLYKATQHIKSVDKSQVKSVFDIISDKKQ